MPSSTRPTTIRLPAAAHSSTRLERVQNSELARTRSREWRQENAEAIADYNEYVEKHGPFADDLRSFYVSLSPEPIRARREVIVAAMDFLFSGF